jgi:adenylate cyclase
MEGRSLTAIGIALFLQRRFDEAAAKLVVSLEGLPSFTTTYRFLASCYAHMGRLDEARSIVTRLKAITPIKFRATFLTGTRSTASYSCRVCA